VKTARRSRACETPPRRRRLRELLCAIAAVVLAGNAPGVSADEQSSSGWKFNVSPYLWAAGISGKVGTLPGLPPADVDESFSDLWNDLQFAGMIAGSARKGRFSMAGDLQYVHTETEDNSLSPIFGGEKLTSKSILVSVLGEYLVLEQDRSELLVSGGIRVWSVETELDLSTGLLPGRKIKGDDTWVDPLIGVRGKIFLGKSDVYLTGWGYVGGFGVGSDSMADLFGGVGYRFTNLVSATLGYRWMKVDRDTDEFLYDVTQQGILAGVSFNF
jgi:hypothetical protein